MLLRKGSLTVADKQIVKLLIVKWTEITMTHIEILTLSFNLKFVILS